MSKTTHSILDMVANLSVVMWANVCTHCGDLLASNKSV